MEGVLLGSQDISWKPEDPQISHWSLSFPGDLLKQALNKDGIAPRGAPQSQIHHIDFSTKHNLSWT